VALLRAKAKDQKPIQAHRLIGKHPKAQEPKSLTASASDFQNLCKASHSAFHATETADH
jgi:hypothetical protein